MRLELAGSLIHPSPLVIEFNFNGNFDTLKYIGLDFTHFEVICIGGGGGPGGGIDTQNTGTLIRSYGGAGGGGGFHRVRGLLSALPDICPVVVGGEGSVGNSHISDPSQTTNGGNGGYSSFNGTTCRASGGIGGKRVQTNSLFEGTLPDNTLADGGDGGVGNRTNAGGGATGGVAGSSGDSDPSGKPGKDGTLFNNIGEGGGGGAGGLGMYGHSPPNSSASSGGRGSYNPSDTSVYGPADNPKMDSNSGILNIIPGGASGAKASPLNGLPTVYGKSRSELLPGYPGVVILRLTAE
jgi:Glycine-rich domain